MAKEQSAVAPGSKLVVQAFFVPDHDVPDHEVRDNLVAFGENGCGTYYIEPMTKQVYHDGKGVINPRWTSFRLVVEVDVNRDGGRFGMTYAEQDPDANVREEATLDEKGDDHVRELR